ncbi:hypothetical protein [Planococcus sp. CAU13]|uniref:hypothetical protein n=1 Tax=Planococcus sp. CAU13 TaxID=1541197 RepID=UPI0005300672|nr:hypothetical protein [Planococcus sp. CAU13]
MKLESIKDLLETICQYNTVNIKQTFTKTETDWIEVRCQPDTRILELTYVQTKTVKQYASIDEAAAAIAGYIHGTSTVVTPNPSEY